jgi:hypothetical protein
MCIKGTMMETCSECDHPEYCPYEPRGNRAPDSLSLEQAISHLVLRKQNLDHIYNPTTSTGRAIVKIREDELDRVLEILSQVRP